MTHTKDTAPANPAQGVSELPDPPIVISTDSDGQEHRVGAYEWRSLDRPYGGAVTISIYIGDHKWVEALLDPQSAKTLADLILAKPCVKSLTAAIGEGGQAVADADLRAVLKSVLYHFGPEGAKKVTDDALRDRSALAHPAPQQGWRPTHRHVKRGSEYEIVGIAEGQVSFGSLGVPQDVIGFDPDKTRFISEGDDLVVYRASDGKLWWRFPDEFNDGRFEALPAARKHNGG